MKIKKKTGLLLAATAAVAATGVAAVSFASWTGTTSELTASAHTGTAYLFGFNSETLNLTTPLVPYDQAAGSYDDTQYAKVVSVALPSFDVYEDYKITVSSETELTFYVLVGAEQTAPAADLSTLGNWKAVSETAVEFEFENEGENTINETGNETVYLSLFLVSNDTEHTNKNVDFTITLVTNPTATNS